MNRTADLGEVIGLEHMKNPHINKNVFTSEAYYQKVSSTMTQEQREFIQTHHVNFIVGKEGGLAEYCKMFPDKKLYVEGGDDILQYLCSIPPEECPIDTFLLTEREGKVEQFKKEGQTVGKGVTLPQVLKCFEKKGLSTDIETEDGIYKIFSFESKKNCSEQEDLETYNHEMSRIIKEITELTHHQ